MRVGTTLYKVVNQPCANGGYEKKRVVWNNSTLRQDAYSGGYPFSISGDIRSVPS